MDTMKVDAINLGGFQRWKQCKRRPRLSYANSYQRKTMVWVARVPRKVVITCFTYASELTYSWAPDNLGSVLYAKCSDIAMRTSQHSLRFLTSRHTYIHPCMKVLLTHAYIHLSAVSPLSIKVDHAHDVCRIINHSYDCLHLWHRRMELWQLITGERMIQP